MTTKPVTIAADASIRECARLMKQHDVSSMLIREGEQTTGIVTGKDFVFKAAADGISVQEPISAIMSPLKYTVSPRVDITEALRLMNKYNVRHLPVMEHGRMVGYITMTAILKIEPQLFELFAEKIELRGIDPGSSVLELLEGDVSGQCESCGNFSSRLTENEGRRVCPNCLL